MPTSTIAAIAAFAALTMVPGIPLALLGLRRVRPNLTVVLVVACGAGLCTWMLIGLPAVHHGRFDRTHLAVAGGIVTALAWIPARHHASMLRPRRPGWLGLWLTALAVPAVVLRSSPVYFPYQVADFGEYVNRANHLAAGGRFGGWFVNGFPLVLGESSLVLGAARTTDVMPFLGLLLGASILAALALVGASRVVIGATAALLTVHVQSVWFSQFPASETLYALVLVVAVLAALVALRGDDPWTAAAVGPVGALLVISRGNGLVYLPVVVAGIALAPLLVDRARTGVLRLHLVALASGLWLGSLYDARYNPRYFLQAQAAPRLPHPVGDAFRRLDEPAVALAFTAAAAVAMAMAVLVSRLAARLTSRPDHLRWARIVLAALVAAGVALAHLGPLDAEAFGPRYAVLGIGVGVALVAAGVAWVRRAGATDLGDATRFLLGWPLLVGVLLATFQGTRMAKSTGYDATWFLYWDRYYFSEAFPMLVLAGATAASVLLARVRRSERRWALPAAGIVGALVVVAALVDTAPGTRQATRHAMFTTAYDDLAALDALMDDRLPVIYDGVREVPEGFFWVNTSRALADPLRESFRRRVVNAAGPLDPDPRVTPIGVRRSLDRLDHAEGYVLQVRAVPEWPELGRSWLDAEVLGEVSLEFHHLHGGRSVDLATHPWIRSRLHVRVVRVGTGSLSA